MNYDRFGQIIILVRWYVQIWLMWLNYSHTALQTT